MGRSDERARLDRLVAENVPAAYRFALRLTGKPQVAEEVVQEALSRAARGWHTFRGEAMFRTWLLRIVVHAFRDLAARRGPCCEALPADLADEDQRPTCRCTWLWRPARRKPANKPHARQPVAMKTMCERRNRLVCCRPLVDGAAGAV